ncbi:biotin-dependent carboxyltransferase family protein [Terasakiella pusilla]|uniref:5-oxoprolinase subunit C family protein n=1 Tax=Terasakiella pusilla TaxID=64973 RepID=UPI00048E8CAC|nr:biotin-dependent carboxyltransferase family protein [Terasakiella pusilla]
MTQSLKILSPGMLASIQDQGRIGYNRYGVPRSGAVDPVLLRLGNALVGNDPYEAAIEFRFMGPSVTAEGGPVRVALACHSGGELLDFATQEKHPVTPFQTITLNEGDILKVFPIDQGATGYLCVESGLALTPVLGSCSTYARAGLGGHNGLPLQSGDSLPVRAPAVYSDSEKIIAEPIALEDGPIHVIQGPQDDHFSEADFLMFVGTPFKVSSDVDRMGIRLEGRKIEALPEKGYDLISDGLVCGAIQVPGSGQPIILAADCQSVGGYPKIASIISCDLYCLGQMVPGKEVSFKAVDLQTAQSLYLQKEAEIEKAIASIRNYFDEGAVDLLALYENNLVGGVVDAQNPGHFPGHLEDM